MYIVGLYIVQSTNDKNIQAYLLRIARVHQILEGGAGETLIQRCRINAGTFYSPFGVCFALAFVQYGAESWGSLLFLGCVGGLLLLPAAWFAWKVRARALLPSPASCG